MRGGRDDLGYVFCLREIELVELEAEDVSLFELVPDAELQMRSFASDLSTDSYESTTCADFSIRGKLERMDLEDCGCLKLERLHSG